MARRALEHHVLEQVRHAGLAVALEARADEVRDVDRHRRLRRVGEQQHLQPVVEPVLGDALDRCGPWSPSRASAGVFGGGAARPWRRPARPRRRSAAARGPSSRASHHHTRRPSGQGRAISSWRPRYHGTEGQTRADRGRVACQRLPCAQNSNSTPREPGRVADGELALSLPKPSTLPERSARRRSRRARCPIRASTAPPRHRSARRGSRCRPSRRRPGSRRPPCSRCTAACRRSCTPRRSRRSGALIHHT